MKLPSFPIEGGCRCERVRFRIGVAPLFTAICHCTGCQRMSGGAFSTTICTPERGFTLLRGECVVGGARNEQVRHHHCDWCKSWVFTRIEPSMGFVNVRATLLDDPRWFEPFIETYTSEGLSWAISKAPHSYPKFPEMSEYAGLVAEFARSFHTDAG